MEKKLSCPLILSASFLLLKNHLDEVLQHGGVCGHVCGQDQVCHAEQHPLLVRVAEIGLRNLSRRQVSEREVIDS